MDWQLVARYFTVKSTDFLQCGKWLSLDVSPVNNSDSEQKLKQTTHFFFYFYLSKKIRLDALCESSATQILYLAENSHEISSLIFSEKQ